MFKVRKELGKLHLVNSRSKLQYTHSSSFISSGTFVCSQRLLVSQKPSFKNSQIIKVQSIKEETRFTKGIQNDYNSTKLLTSPQVLSPLIIKRNINKLVPFTFGTGWIMKLALVGSLAFSYFLLQRFVRLPWRQRVYIRNTFLAHPNITIPDNFLRRTFQEERMINYFKLPPAGPIVMIGPDGSGKSSIMKRVLFERPMTIVLDLRQNPVTSDDEFMWQFVASIGYKLPSSDFLARWLLRESAVKERRIARIEVDKALSVLIEMLSIEKVSGWKNGIPVIWIHGMEILQNNTNRTKGEKSKKETNYFEDNIVKFLDFCIHATDMRLCHVVFTTQYDYSCNILDKHPGWRLRREVININFPTAKVLTDHLDKNVNKYLLDLGKNKFSENEISHIVKCIGGSMTDIRLIITEYLRGQSPQDTVDRMVADSMEKIENVLECFLADASNAKRDGKKDLEKYYLEQYMRFWNLMQLFSKKSSESRLNIIRSVFKDNPLELDQYQGAGIIYYIVKPTSVQISDEVTQKEIVPSSSIKSDKSPAEVVINQIESVYVIPSIPRIRMAFSILLNDPRVKDQTTQVVKTLQKQELSKEKKEVLEEISLLDSRKRDLIKEQQLYVENYSSYQSFFGSVELERRKNLLLQKTDKVDQILEQLERRVSEISQQIK